MTARARHLATTATIALTAMLVLSGCGGAAAPAETTPAVTEGPAPTTPAPEAPPTEEPAAEPACETIIPPATVEDFAEIGWTANSQPLRAGSIELSGGIQCTWGDYTVATDHVQIFGWAPIDAAQTDDAIAELLASGWRREDADGGIYITESPETAIATDDEGYGLTYFFSDGAVEMADTKQGLLLVEWPPA